MKTSLRVCALAVVLSCVAAVSLMAEVTAPTSPAPVDAPGPVPAPAPAQAPVVADAPTPPPAPIDPVKEVEIRKLIQLSGTERMMDQMKAQMFTMFRQKAGTLPPEFWTKLDKEMDSKQLLDKLIPIYDKYYTLDDLKAVNAFYLSPVGQRILQNQPLVLKESMAVGRQWGQQAAMKTMVEMQQYQHNSSAPAPAPSSP